MTSSYSYLIDEQMKSIKAIIADLVVMPSSSEWKNVLRTEL
jgi:hypothetical protein